MSPKKAVLIDGARVEETSDVEETEDAEDSTPGRLKRLLNAARHPVSGKILAGLVVLVVVASLSLLGGLLWFSYRPDRETDGAAAKDAIAAASDGARAILSYSPETIDNDLASARSHLTAPFLSYYDDFTKQIVAPAAKQKSVKTTAVVLRAALTKFAPDSAEVLMFVNQSTVSVDLKEPTLINSSVLVSLTKADGKWLISQFTPI